MKNKKLIVGAVFLAAVLVIGIGYAAINQVPLTISGTTNVETAQGNFKVSFTDTILVSDEDKVEASIGDPDVNGAKLTAVMNVSGLTAKGDKVTATYEIENTSPDLFAELSVGTPTVSKTEYFTARANINGDSTIAAKTGKTTVTIEVELIKTPITDSDVATAAGTITTTVTATPVQPQ